MGLIKQRGGQRGLCIGIMGQGPQYFAGEGFEHLHQHLLLVGQRQIEQAIRSNRPRRTARFTGTLRGGAKTRAATVVDKFLDGLAQFQTIRPVGLGESIQHGQGTALDIGSHDISLHTGDATIMRASLASGYDRRATWLRQQSQQMSQSNSVLNSGNSSRLPYSLR